MYTATVSPIRPVKPYKKENIPRALRGQLWIRDMGQKFKGKYRTTWCHNNVTVFDFHPDHDIPESNDGNLV